jgi:signal transduction histidine kinase/DNA-binding response OmpR family regulator/HPt (histidine-containing phosphotransfer) domain-containing protein
MSQPAILFVDDEPHVLKAMERHLVCEPYDLFFAPGGQEGLAILDREKIDVVVSDMRMPGMDGLEFLSQVRQRHPDVVRMVLSGMADMASLVGAINDGQVYRYVTKPLNELGEFRAALRQALEYGALRRREKALMGELERRNREMERQHAMQALLTDISGGFIDLPLGEMDGAIKEALGACGRLVGADRAYVFEVDEAERVCRNSHEWCAAGIEPHLDDLQAVPFEMAPRWIERHLRGLPMGVPDVSALPVEDGVRRMLEPQGVQSLYAVPLMQGARCMGFAGFDFVRSAHAYHDDEQRLLGVFARMLASLSQRRKMEEELRRSREAAEAANRAKSEFLANMSHEIRTPMNGVIGMLGLLCGAEMPAEPKRYAETALSSAESLLDLLNDILDFSRMEAGRLKLETLDLDLRKAMDWAVAPLAMRARQKGVAFVCAVAPNVPVRLRGDPVRLRQVLVNLAGNAVKFTETGEIALSADLAEEKDGRVKVRFAVRDTGVGVPKEHVGSLFEKFTQGDASTTRRFGGTGLGLAIAKQLAEMMHGEIGVESEEGRGSTFWFTAWFDLPQAEAAEMPVEPGPGQGEAPPSKDAGRYAGRRVLVVDDNEVNRMVATGMLKSAGAEVDEAAGGEEALAALGRASYDLVLLDVQMPEMDGYEVTRRIRAGEGTGKNGMLENGNDGEAEGKNGMLEYGNNGGSPSSQHSTIPPFQFPGSSQHSTIPPFQFPGSSQHSSIPPFQSPGSSQHSTIPPFQFPGSSQHSSIPPFQSPGSSPPFHSASSPRLTIVAMTAHAMPGDREKCLAAGMDDYLPKPIKPEAMAYAMDKWLGGGGGPSASPPSAAPAASASAFEPAALLERAMEDKTLAVALIGKFLETTPAVVEGMRAAIKAENAEELAGHAHNLKGAAANMCAETLRAAALELERAAKAGDWAAARARRAEVEAQHEILKALMSRQAAEWR